MNVYNNPVVSMTSNTLQRSSGLFRLSRTGVLAACTLALVALASQASAQLTPVWSALHAGVDGFFFGFNVPVSVVTDSDGAVYVNSSINRNRFTDMLTVKYDADGNMVWSRIYDGPSGNPEAGLGITIDSAGDILALGRSEGDFLVVKYDALDGSVIWVNQHDGGNSPEQPRAFTTDASGSIYVTGYTRPPGGDHQEDYYTYKLDSSGNLLWTATYDGPGQFLVGNDIAEDIALDSNGDVIVTGTSNSINNQANFVTIKYRASDGAQVWFSRIDLAGLESVAMLISPEDDVYVTGSTRNGRTPFATVKINGIDGSELWRSVNNLGAFGRAFGMALDSQGDVYVTGRLDPDWDRSTLNENVMIMRLRASDGARLWLSSYGDSAQNKYDEGLAIAIDSQDHVLVTGSTNSFGIFGLLLLQIDAATGSILDSGAFPVPNVGVRGLAITFDLSENVIVAGMTRGGTSGMMDMITVKYESFITGVTVLPTSYTVKRGVLTSGGLADLYASDDQRLNVRAGITLFAAESPLQVELTGTATTGAPSELRFKLEAMANTPNLGQTIEMYNYVTSQYEEVDFWIAGPTDTVVEVVISTNPERFIKPGTKEMKSKVSYYAVGITLFWPWTASIDQATWTVIP